MFFHIGDAYFGPLSFVISILAMVVGGTLTSLSFLPRTRDGRAVAFVVGAGGGLVVSAVLVFAIPAIAATNSTTTDSSTTYATKTGTITYERGSLFDSPRFVFETFGSDGIARRYCDPERTTFVPGDPDRPTLTVITERGVDTTPLAISMPSEAQRCEVSGADGFLDDYWVER